MREVVFSADDFGLTPAVNEAVERAHRDGILDQASLMVAGAAAGDAVRRARAMPSLKVGLHLVVIEGPAVSPAADIPLLVDGSGRFPSDQAALGLRYFFSPEARRQLAREIRAQFAAFAATGLRLDHANAHKHMHLHPTVGRMMIRDRPRIRPDVVGSRPSPLRRWLVWARAPASATARCTPGPGCCGTRRAPGACASTIIVSASNGAAI